MAQIRQVVIGIYPDRDAVESAVARLKEAGFRGGDISALLPESDAVEAGPPNRATKAPEAAAGGAATGAVLGGALGWLVGTGALAVPGLGPLVAAGPIVSLLAGAGVGGTVLGLAGGLIGLGFPEYEARRYEGRVREGRILLSVHCDSTDMRSRADQILEETGAEDISSSGEYGAEEEEGAAVGGELNTTANKRAGNY